MTCVVRSGSWRLHLLRLPLGEGLRTSFEASSHLFLAEGGSDEAVGATQDFRDTPTSYINDRFHRHDLNPCIHIYTYIYIII